MYKIIFIFFIVLTSNFELIPCAFAIDNKYEFLKSASPKADPEIINAFYRYELLLSKNGISENERNQFIHFFSQVATETGGFRKLKENLKYSEKNLLKVFPKRITIDQAKLLAGDELKIARYVYNGRLGNNKKDDGFTYRGSGILQLTGRRNFDYIGKHLNKPFLNEPDLVRKLDDAILAGIEYWKWKNINKAAKKDDIRLVRRLINGGKIGLPESKIWTAQIKREYLKSRTLGPRLESRQIDEDMEINIAVAEQLINLGYLKKGPKLESSLMDVTYKEALKKFQTSQGLNETAIVDNDTIYRLTDPYGRFED